MRTPRTAARDGTGRRLRVMTSDDGCDNGCEQRKLRVMTTVASDDSGFVTYDGGCE